MFGLYMRVGMILSSEALERSGEEGGRGGAEMDRSVGEEERTGYAQARHDFG